jgi:myo-inositol-1(or 4)-monophosphatase
MSRVPLGAAADLMRALVDRAGDLLRRRLGRVREVRYKHPTDLVTEMDQAVEKLFLTAIHRRFPEHEVLSEEREEAAGRDPWRRPAASSRPRWVLDPLDGTTNYAHGFPHFAVSVGLVLDGRVVLGAVANPMLGETFFAQRGRGARCNGRIIRVSGTQRVAQALLATGFPYDVRTARENNFAYFQAMARASQAVRRAGSAALDLCDLACGRFDGFWELKLKPWDVAAGSLMLEEAGGRITGLTGRRFDLYGGSFLASNGRLHAELTRVLAGARRGRTPGR